MPPTHTTVSQHSIGPKEPRYWRRTSGIKKKMKGLIPLISNIYYTIWKNISYIINIWQKHRSFEQNNSIEIDLHMYDLLILTMTVLKSNEGKFSIIVLENWISMWILKVLIPISQLTNNKFQVDLSSKCKRQKNNWGK